VAGAGGSGNGQQAALPEPGDVFHFRVLRAH